MKIATQRLLHLLSRPTQNATILYSTTKTSLSAKASFRHFCVMSHKQGRMYFSTSKDPMIEEPSAGEDSNLATYIKNLNTIEILEKKGIKSLFPIQIETFEAVYQSMDLLASDRTGSGKTIAYSLPILEKLRDKGIFKSGNRQVKFLIMCPTRELAIQVFKQVSSLKHNNSDFNVVAIYGGSSIDDQIRELRNGIDVIVATPGRLMDLVQRKCINFSELVATCIDEADQMLEKGFKLDIEQIFELISTQRKQKTQNLMFSATIPDWVDKISSQYMDKKKKRINLISKSETQTSTTVEHLAVECSAKDRVSCIQTLIKGYNPTGEMRTIIFSETKMEVIDIAMEFGKIAAFLQGDMDQKQREFNLNAFRTGKRKILIATDVASRGLDIDNVGLVIQLQPPRNTEPFIHRAGRTGRAGKSGICITLFDKQKNLQSMLKIENEAKITFKHISRLHLNNTKEAWQKKLNSIPHQLKELDKKVLQNQNLDKMVDVLISGHSDIKQLIKRQLLAIAGEPPANVSLTSEESGFKTFSIKMKQEEEKIDTMRILNFVKSNFSQLKVTNVHIQSNNILFDVPEENLDDFVATLSTNLVKDSPYEVSEASGQDRQMSSLKDIDRSLNRRFSDRSQGRRDGYERWDKDQRTERSERNQERYPSSRNDRNFQLANSSSLSLFIPRLPYLIDQSNLKQVLNSVGIQYTKVNLKKKSEQNVFAFVDVTNSMNFKKLLKNGIEFNGQKFRAYEAKSNFAKPSGRDTSFEQSRGDRKDNRRGGNRDQLEEEFF